MRASAVVFAYHDVGVRCLSVLLAGGIDVKLVVTHADDPRENIWFASVARLAGEHGIAVIWDRDILEFFLIGMVLFGLGITGEYVGRIYQQVRERPRYLIQAILEKRD